MTYILLAFFLGLVLRYLGTNGIVRVVRKSKVDSEVATTPIARGYVFIYLLGSLLKYSGLVLLAASLTKDFLFN